MNRIYKSLANGLLLILLLFNVEVSIAQKVPIVFKNVNVIPMSIEMVILDGQDVLITDGGIKEIGNTGDLKIPEGALVIESSGMYLIPGFTEMHAHIPSKSQGKELIEETLFLYLSQGVTTIRGMLGESYHLELQEKVASGDILGPRIYTSGPSLNGNSVKTVEAAREMVQNQKKAGYDFLKLHPGLKLEVFDEIVKTAHEVGIPFAGHVSLEVGIRHALESGYASIDHLDGYVEGLVPQEAGVEPGENGFFGINFAKIADEAKITELAEMTRQNNVWVVPTQSLMERWVGPGNTDELMNDPAMKYMSPATTNRWKSSRDSYTSASSYSRENAARFIELRQKIIKSLFDSGVGMALCSDAPQVFNVPGFSVLNELESMVKCGLTPYQALQMATANPARFFNAEGKFGTIGKGASADLVLLSENPLVNISNCRKQQGVVLKGNWISAKEIKDNLQKISVKYDSGN